MTATQDGPILRLVDVDVYGNEIVTERIFSDEGKKQVSFFRSGGAKSVRNFEKVPP